MINQLKTVFLLGLLTALLLWIGNYFGGPTGLTIAFIIVLAINFVMYWFSDKIVLSMYKAKPIGHESKVYGIVRDLARKAGVPVPKVYLIPSENPNAFATGRDPSHAAVAVTQGILDLLDERELKGVLAHEISHIKNRDTLIATVAATLAGVIAYLASMARWAAIFGGWGDKDRRDSGLELLFLAILTPLIATIIQLAISREREYFADSSAATATKDPKGLADALLKIDAGVKVHPMRFGNPATSSLFIANPFKGEALFSLFSTHPPIKARVERLLQRRS